MAETHPELTQPEKATRRLPVWVIVLAFAVLLGFLVLIFQGLRRAQQGAITVGQQVPSLALTTFDGQTIHTGDLKGKTIVLNFWASWCKPCEGEAADLQTAYELYKPGGEVVFLGVDYVDTEPEARAYLSQFNITYPNGPDLGTRISQAFRISGVPETYIISPSGKLGFAQIGPFNSVDEIKAAIEKVRTDPSAQ